MTLWDCCGRRRSLAVLASRIKHRASNRRRSNLSQAHQKSIRAVDDLIPTVMLLTNDVFFGDRQALHKASWDVTRASRTRRDSLHHWWSGAKISRDPRSFLRHVARNTTRIQRLTVDRMVFHSIRCQIAVAMPTVEVPFFGNPMNFFEVPIARSRLGEQVGDVVTIHATQSGVGGLLRWYGKFRQ